MLHHLCRLFCLFFLGVNVAAAAIKPLSTVQADDYQPDSKSPTPPPTVVDSSVRSLSHSEPETPPQAEQIYNDFISDLKDADRANMDSHRAYESSRTTDRFVTQILWSQFLTQEH